jgi:hypothetical protein
MRIVLIEKRCCPEAFIVQTQRTLRPAEKRLAATSMNIFVIPAKAGIHFYAMLVRATKWIPAFAGMTEKFSELV